jgi:S-adenosylmethionine:tRNA ribosyltransferase-isomerase
VRTDELDYDLPPDLVAQRPAGRRDESRLLVYDRATGDIRHRVFRDLPNEAGGALVVVNDTRVLPARLALRRPGGGEAEVLLLEPLRGGEWEGLARPTRRLRPGMRLGPVELVEHLGEGRWRLRLEGEPDGATPLPPYITEPLADPERYQTVYAERPGSAAAPTAGLHFTPELLARLDTERVTLHVGLDTFRPVSAETLAEHELAGERYEVEPAAWERIRAAPRVLAVGTTTTRVLESLARGAPLAGRTGLFITPGFEFRRVDALLTNFHLPRSTLLALVMAFAGVEETRALYAEAIRERYRFYSFGDAMLLL